MSKKYYERSLEDFPDEVIVKVRESKDRSLWYASMNTPPRNYSFPDFATAGATREEAIARCAKVMRDDARGIGKYAPHSCFRGYDLHWILCPWWATVQGEVIDDYDTETGRFKCST